jgi:hypothetical protein
MRLNRNLPDDLFIEGDPARCSAHCREHSVIEPFASA